jgi:imidazolonepropionase
MDLVVHNARVMTCDPALPGLGIIDHGAIAIHGLPGTAGGLTHGTIAWVGADRDRPRGTRELDAKGALVTPGLVDCHTHAIFGGDRSAEFALRAGGATYQQIAAEGGGIAATLGPTRLGLGAGVAPAADRRWDEAAAGKRPPFAHVGIEAAFAERLWVAARGGTTTMEVKTGYALTTEGELALLATIDTVRASHPVAVVPTLLAHLVPPERRGDRDAFVAEICEQWIPRATTATSVDVWCEDAAFTLAETRRMFEAAKRTGKAVRGHVGQMSDLGAAELLAEYGALSADHLEHASDAGIAALARAGTVAVMLPGACVQLRLPVPPVAKLREAGVRMAIATDFNPGSSWSQTLPIQMWLATTHYQMTIEEAWLGVTRHAAAALAVGNGAGTLAAGVPACFVVWNCDQPAHVPYYYGGSLVEQVCAHGALLTG